MGIPTTKAGKKRDDHSNKSGKLHWHQYRHQYQNQNQVINILRFSLSVWFHIHFISIFYLLLLLLLFCSLGLPSSFSSNAHSNVNALPHLNKNIHTHNTESDTEKSEIQICKNLENTESRYYSYHQTSKSTSTSTRMNQYREFIPLSMRHYGLFSGAYIDKNKNKFFTLLTSFIIRNRIISSNRKISTSSPCKSTSLRAQENKEGKERNVLKPPQYIYQETKIDQDTVYGNDKFFSVFDGFFHHQPSRSLYSSSSSEKISTIPAIPAGYTLRKLIIIHRHGDRTPITKTIGNVLSDHNREEYSSQWAKRLPNSEEIEKWNRQFPVTPSDLKPLDYNDGPYAQLTKRGGRQLYNIGRAIRKHYLSKESENPHTFPYDTDLELSNMIFARATNIRRTQQSVQNLLRGIFLVDDDNKKVAVTPCSGNIPIHIVPTEEEYLYPNSAGQCPRQTQIVADTRARNYDLKDCESEDNTTSASAIDKEKDIIVGPKLKSNTNANVGRMSSSSPINSSFVHDFSSKLKSFEQIRDYCYETFHYDKEKYQYIPFTHVKEVMLCHLVHDVKLPPEMQNFSPEWLKKIMNFTVFMWGKWFYNQELLRLGIGPFLQEMLDVITTSPNKNIPETRMQTGKIFIYSGHDSTIVPILCTLKNFNTEARTAIWPPYASTIMVEICDKNVVTNDQQNEPQTMIRFLYNDQELQIPVPSRMELEVKREKNTTTSNQLNQKEEFKTWISLEELQSLWLPLIPQNFNEECKLKE